MCAHVLHGVCVAWCVCVSVCDAHHETGGSKDMFVKLVLFLHFYMGSRDQIQVIFTHWDISIAPQTQFILVAIESESYEGYMNVFLSPRDLCSLENNL